MRLGNWWRSKDDVDLTLSENWKELKQAWRELIRTIKGKKE